MKKNNLAAVREGLEWKDLVVVLSKHIILKYENFDQNSIAIFGIKI